MATQYDKLRLQEGSLFLSPILKLNLQADVNKFFLYVSEAKHGGSVPSQLQKKIYVCLTV